MPGAHPRAEPPRKRIKLTKQDERFTTVDEIRAMLRLQNYDELTKGLSSLRNQLTIKHDEGTISVHDERLLLAQNWMSSDPGAQDVFQLWESATQNQTMFIASILGVLSALLNLFSSHYTFHQHGQLITKTLLAPQWMRRLNALVKGAYSDLTLVALKLLNAISTFGGGRDRTKLRDSFAWDAKTLSKLLHMRRKSKVSQKVNDLRNPDIRTLYLLLVLSFVDSDNSTSLKSTFLEQHKDIFLSIFKGLVQDAYPVVLKVLEVCWRGILSDSKLKRTLKVALFSETTIAHIAKLYDRSTSEDDDPDHIPADVAHHFLLALCTRPGAGVCFKDRGWYHRDSTDEDLAQTEADQRGGKIHNKILANVLKSLKVNDDPRQQELALKIMGACPELPSSYWNGAALTLEPRLSSKWIANISFFGSVISLPVPEHAFLLPQSTQYQPSPPPLSTIMENIIPTVNTRAYIGKGLQSSSPLVQHCTAITLAKCFLKYADVVRIFQCVASSLGEDDVDGQWCKRLAEMEKELRKRVPDFQVVVAFAQQTSAEGPTPTGRQPNVIRNAMLSECAQRLLWLYHRCLPLLVAEARFDVGKLLQNFITNEPPGSTVGDQGSSDGEIAFRSVRQLHVLRLLKESDQFVWSAKHPSSSTTYISILLKTYNNTTLKRATRSALTALICQALSDSILFQEDPDESSLWLAALPQSKRSPDAEAPDGARLTDEGDGVIHFLDDCMQRCLKTPYRYIEELRTLAKTSTDQDLLQDLETLPSPLLMTVLEQLRIQVSLGRLSPSDILALATFVRKLILKLSAKQRTLKLLCAMANEVDKFLSSDILSPDHPVVSGAIRREVSILHHCLGKRRAPTALGSDLVRDQVDEFLLQVETLSPVSIPAAKIVSAFELSDWVHLVDVSLTSGDIRRLVKAIELRHKPALKELCLNLHPADGLLWEGLDILSSWRSLLDQSIIEFDWLLAHLPDVSTPSHRDLLVEILFGKPVSPVDIKRALCLVIHRLLASMEDSDVCQAFFILMSEIMRRSRVTLSPMDGAGIREYVFLQTTLMDVFGDADGSSEILLKGFALFIESSLDSACLGDRRLVTDITNHYLDVLKANVTSGDSNKIPVVKLWINYFEPEVLCGLLTFIAEESGEMTSSVALDILPTILQSLQRHATSPDPSFQLYSHCTLPQLVALLPILEDNAILEEMIAARIMASLPVHLDVDPPSLPNGHQLASQINIAESQWSRRLESDLGGLRIETFLEKRFWTISTVRIISGLLYRLPSAQAGFLHWLHTGNAADIEIEHYASVLHTFLDVACSDPSLNENDFPALEPCFPRLVAAVSDGQISHDLKRLSTSCITLIVHLFPSKRSLLLSSLEGMLRSLHGYQAHTHLLTLGRSLHATACAESDGIVDLLIDYGLRWIIACCAGDNELGEDEQAFLAELGKLLKAARQVKSHSTETALTVVIKHRLNEPSCVDLLSDLLRTTQLKPLTINRQLQSILQHPRFFQLCGPESAARDPIINLLHVLFHIHPNNTCQPSHIEPLLPIYTASCSVSDLQVLSIFRLFESQRGVSLATLVSRWSPTPDLSSNTALEAINNLNPSQVLHTCLAFPDWRRLQDVKQSNAKDANKDVYDPIFLVPLFARMLLDCPPSSASGWVELFRTNIVCFLIRCLSSTDDGLRDLALYQIVALWKSLQTADVQEKSHVMYILDLLKNTLPEPSKDLPSMRLPTYTTLILLHALRGIFYPSHFLYPLTSRFLLQRPELDLGDVPMLYGMLYSSSDDWKRERLWIVRFLADGMVCYDDWKVLKRRHTWDLLASFFQASENDDGMRNAVLEVLANLTCNTQATTSLMLKSGLLSWIEMQLMANTRSSECIAWLKILHNIMAIVDPTKLETATHGAWRSMLCRSCSYLLNNGGINFIATFSLAAQAILRLALLPGVATPRLPNLLTVAMDGLQRLEKGLESPQISMTMTQHHDIGDTYIPPYRSRTLHQAPVYKHPLHAWGCSVEALWRVAMHLEEKNRAWDELTCRLLLWRSIVGSEERPMAEWVHREVVKHLLD